jgi:hypothetical protein
MICLHVVVQPAPVEVRTAGARFERRQLGALVEDM